MPWMITSTALLKTWAALCQQSPKIPYKWIFYFCIPWDRGSYCFCKWETKQWLIPRGLVRAHTWNAFCCRVVWHDYEEQEKNKVIILKNPLSSQQGHGITQQAWGQQTEWGRHETGRTKRDSCWDQEEIKLTDMDFWTFAEQQHWFCTELEDLLLSLPQSIGKGVAQIFLSLSHFFLYYFSHPCLIKSLCMRN